MGDLSQFEKRERSDRNREAGASIFGLAVLGLITYRLLQITGPPLWFEILAWPGMSIVLFVGFWQLAAALVSRPTAIEAHPGGIELRYRDGNRRLISWRAFARRNELREISAETNTSTLPIGNKMWLRRPLPHSFWIPSDVFARVRAEAKMAGLVEVETAWRRFLVAGTRPFGKRLRFRPQGGPFDQPDSTSQPT
jgi:hypothetical protein